MLIFSLTDWAEAVSPVASRVSSATIPACKYRLAVNLQFEIFPDPGLIIRLGKPYLSTARAGTGLNV
jgi:hypothetical protein